MISPDDDIRRKRLLYQAQHRGFKEADLVIGGFAAAHILKMSAVELDEFESLLAHPDHELFAWATGDRPPPPEINGPLFRRLRAFDVSRPISAVGARES